MADKQEAFQIFDFDLKPVRGYPEIRWAGKRPFSSTQFFPAQRKEAYGDPTDGWWNKLFWGDNLQVTSHLLREFRGQVDLIYLDPPFDSKADYKKRVKVRGHTAESDQTGFEEKQYTDIWNNDDYLQFLYERIIILRELLSDTGSIYVHCDANRSHYIKCLLDEVFGTTNFRNEIVWKRTSARADSKTYNHIHDTIFFYTKTDDFVWNRQFTEHSESYLRSKYKRVDENGRRYRLDNITSPNPRPNMTYEWKGFPPPANGWRYSRDRMAELDAEGRIWYPDEKTKRPQLIRFLDESAGRPLDTVWSDIFPVNSQASDRLNYPTQKPVELLERLIKVSSNPGDIVLDSFMGSGTTQAVAMKTGRRFLGADINLGSIETSVARLNRVRDELHSKTGELLAGDVDEGVEKLYSGFEVYNVNNYDIFRNPVEAKELIKEAMELQPLPTSSLFDGQRDQFLVKIMPVNRIATRQDLNEVIAGMDFRAYERRQAEAPSKIVDRIMLVCMGHEPDLGEQLKLAAKPFNIEVDVVDLIRDKANLHFKRQSDAKLVIKDGHLEIAGFYPLNLLQKLSMDTDAVQDWRQLVETIKVDWNYDGAVLSPELIDAPDKDALVTGRYPIPDDASTIRVKITDLLSESWEGEIDNG